VEVAAMMKMMTIQPTMKMLKTGLKRLNASSLTSAAVPKELTLDYAEINAVPPLHPWLSLAAD